MMTTSQVEEDRLKAEARQKKYNGFSCPQEGLDEEFARQIAVKFARKCLRLFLDRFGNLLESEATGLKNFLEGWIGQDCSFEEAWSPFFGALHEALRSTGEISPDDILERAGSLGLHLMAAGYAGEWGLNLQSQSRFRFDTLLLPWVNHLRVSAGGGRVRLEMGLPPAETSTVELIKNATGWGYDGDELKSLPRIVIGGRPICLMSAGYFDTREAALFDNVTPSIEDFSVIQQKYEETVELITATCPEYLEWVGRALRGIVPVEMLDGARCSGSDILRPGLIYVSMDASPVYLAEAMIHEGTHQYMFMLARLGQLENGTDTGLYYSPARRTNRPIGAIAVAYHAFANVLLFYRGCIANGMEDNDFIQEHLETTVENVAELEKTLRSTTGLSAQGRAIWEPLAPRL